MNDPNWQTLSYLIQNWNSYSKLRFPEPRSSLIQYKCHNFTTSKSSWDHINPNVWITQSKKGSSEIKAIPNWEKIIIDWIEVYGLIWGRAWGGFTSSLSSLASSEVTPSARVWWRKTLEYEDRNKKKKDTRIGTEVGLREGIVFCSVLSLLSFWNTS